MFILYIVLGVQGSIIHFVSLLVYIANLYISQTSFQVNICLIFLYLFLSTGKIFKYCYIFLVFTHMINLNIQSVIYE